MPSDNSFSRRIKRHVVGRIHPFFAATAPGFETLCSQEISAIAPAMKNAAMVPGGIEFEGRLAVCYLANLHLRTANRILMRIAQFKASAFRQIERKASAIPWELYLPTKSWPQIRTTTHHCRLYHSEAIGERILDSISNHGFHKTADRNKDSSFKPTIFVRGVDDRFTVSIDSSGDPLHKRGLKRHRGIAPLRETAAAAALLLAGYRGDVPLIDPMCGSGTFSLEAAMIVNNIPAGWFREFDFMRWPSYRPPQWDYLKRQCQTHIVDRQTPLIFASDIESSACSRLEKCLRNCHLSKAVKVSQQDFFDFLPADLTDQIGLVAINPAYGRRLENRSKSEQLFLKICARLKREYKGWRLILISPNKKLTKKVPFKLDIQPLFHGGIRPVLMVGTIS